MSVTSVKLESLKENYNSIVRSRNLLLDINHFNDEAITNLDNTITTLREQITDETFRLLTQVKPRLKSSKNTFNESQLTPLGEAVNYIEKHLTKTKLWYKYNRVLIEDFYTNYLCESPYTKDLYSISESKLTELLKVFYNNL